MKNSLATPVRSLSLVMAFGSALMVATTAWAAPFAHERYVIGADGVGYLPEVYLPMMVNEPIGTTQYLPPESTGIISYYGEFNGIDDDTSPDLRWTDGSARLVFQVTRGSLIYDNLSVLGGKLEVARGGVSAYLRLDTTDDGVFKDYLEKLPSGTNNPTGGNLIGKDGTTLYFSFLYKLDLATDSGNQNIIVLADTVNLVRSGEQLTRTPTRKWTFGQTWGTTEFRADPSLSFGTYDTDTHFIVVKVQFADGNDTVSVWFDPDLTKTEGEQAPVTAAHDMRFNAIQLIAQKTAPGQGFSFDELRFGASWDDVVETGCNVTQIVFTEDYWNILEDDFVSGINYEAFLYTGYCPFVYDFSTSNWLYLHDAGASAEGFFAYDFSVNKWVYFFAGYKLPLE